MPTPLHEGGYWISKQYRANLPRIQEPFHCMHKRQAFYSDSSYHRQKVLRIQSPSMGGCMLRAPSRPTTPLRSGYALQSPKYDDGDSESAFKFLLSYLGDTLRVRKQGGRRPEGARP